MTLDFGKIFFALITVQLADASGKCKAGHFGSHCNLTCSNTCALFRPDPPCDKITGECTEGCKTGFHGQTCNKTCPCVGSCIQLTGECLNENAVTTTESQTDQPHVLQGKFADNTCGGGSAPWIVISVILFLVLLAVIVLFIYMRRAKETTIIHRLFRIEHNKERTNGPEVQTMLENESVDIQTNEVRQSEDEREVVLQQHKRELKELKDEVQQLKDKNERLGKEVVSLEEKARVYAEEQKKWKEVSKDFAVNISAKLKLDPKKAIKDRHVDSVGVLWNKPNLGGNNESDDSFRYYRGTTSTEPLTRSLQYYEVIGHFKPRDDHQVIFDFGFCAEKNRDNLRMYTMKEKNCYCLRVEKCETHERLCILIFKDGELVHDKPSFPANTNNLEETVHIGFYINEDMKKIYFFDISKYELMKDVDVHVDGSLWPMFGLDGGATELKLISGDDIDITPAKVAMLMENQIVVLQTK